MHNKISLTCMGFMTDYSSTNTTRKESTTVEDNFNW